MYVAITIIVTYQLELKLLLTIILAYLLEYIIWIYYKNIRKIDIYIAVLGNLRSFK